MSNHSELHARSQQPQKRLVDADYSSLTAWLNCCPVADTLTAWSAALKREIIIQLRCKRWGCPHCGPRRVAHTAHRVKAARPNKFVTLTTRVTDTETPREAYDRTRRKLSTLVRGIRKTWGYFEYMRVLEVTKKGWPHYHLVARAAWIDQAWLSAEWQRLADAHIVDIRAIRKKANVVQYLVKYLYKQSHVPWTNRRLSWSPGFFNQPPDDPPPPLDLMEPKKEGMSPATYFSCYHHGREIEEYGADAWLIV